MKGPMNGKSVETPILTSSVRVYRALLAAYPATFRREYGPHMLQVFRDSCLRTFAERGTAGMFRLWAITLFDFLHTMFEQHIQKEAGLSGPQRIRMSGWVFMVGSFGYVSMLQEKSSIAGMAISSILLGVGLLGLRASYGEKVGSFGRKVLLSGVIAMLLLYASLAAVYFFRSVNPLAAARYFDPGYLWIVPYGGPAFELLGLGLFGLAALRTRPMSRFNWLPLLTGIWFPAMYFPVCASVFLFHSTDFEHYTTPLLSVAYIQFLALCLFGFVLAIDTQEAPATT
jgi:hypothetical protein